jgi:isochorismate synthase EntC
VAEALQRIEEAYRDAGFPAARASAEWRETDAKMSVMRAALGV